MATEAEYEALRKRIAMLEARQADMNAEIRKVKRELESYRAIPSEEETDNLLQISEELEPEKTTKAVEQPAFTYDAWRKTSDMPVEQTEVQESKVEQWRDNFERFVGENLISKIGILITVIGVIVGVKYAIDHDLINPLFRIVMAYALGGALVGTAFYLKKDYTNFSAVLLSGAMAILYFTTYAAYDFYQLIPQVASFLIMTLFTAFTVFAAVQYNQPVIAHLGLVGAYAVPFLLSDGSGRVAVLFSFVSLVNIGILAVAVQRYWKSLLYLAFVATWAIYFAWFGEQFNYDIHFKLALIFSAVFFLVFYATFLSYKLVKLEKYSHTDVFLMLVNSFVYFTAGYALLDSQEATRDYLGLFTLANAIVHFIVAYIIFSKKLADRNLFFLAVGMVLSFVTIAIPVQLDGNYVSFLWAAEALLLFWIGRSRKVPFYEASSYALIALSSISLVHDWSIYFDTVLPVLRSITFLGSVVQIISLGGILYLAKRYPSQMEHYRFVPHTLLQKLPGVLFVVVLYFAFFLEIGNYFWGLYKASAIEIPSSWDPEELVNKYNNSYRSFQMVWLLIYSLWFAVAALVVVRKQAASRNAGLVTIIISILFIWLSMTPGLFVLADLRQAYQYPSEYFTVGWHYLGIRYLLMLSVVALSIAIHRFSQNDFMQPFSAVLARAIVYVPLWLLASNELIHQMTLAESDHSYKLELSILWGLFAVVLVVWGIVTRTKDLRIASIVLFAITLVKLLAYDLSHLSTIGKTLVLVILGILMLIVSFLYNKFKDRIFNDD